MKRTYYAGALAGLLLAGAITLSAAEAQAAIEVNVMPSGVLSKTNLWDSGPYAYPGQNLELWGNVSYDGSKTLTYTWTFGDGSAAATGTVTTTNRNNIAANHAYASGSYLATLTVSEVGGTQTSSDTVSIDVVPNALEIQTNYAIQRGLKYLYMTKASVTLNGQQAYRWHGDTNAISALSVLAFENHGHLASNAPNGDIYADTVKGGLNQLFNVLSSEASSKNDSSFIADINGNLLRVYSSNDLYRQSIMAMAIAGSASPDAVVGPAGSTAVRGKTYKVVLEDMIDWIAYAQQDGNNLWTGGWRYSATFGSSDNSVSQWPALALGEAERAPWGITPPAWVKTRMALWLAASQAPDGGYYYDAYYYNSTGGNAARTGGAIAQMAVAGYFGTNNERLTKALNFLNTYWNSEDSRVWLYHYNFTEHYSVYSVKKGLDFAHLTHVGSHDWQQEYDQWYVNKMVNQGTNGASWNGTYWVSGSYNPTAWALLIMAPLEVCLPVARAGADQEIGNNSSVSLDGSASTHTCSSNTLVSYEWDCDYDGINFTTDKTGAMTTCAYTLPGGVASKTYTAALRVTDDQSPAKKAIDSLLVKVDNGNVAPVANPGGPYTVGVGEVVTLDGSGSTDINACPEGTPGHPECLGDSIIKYEWDIDGDGLYGTADSPADPVGITATFSATSANTYPVGLKVTDSFGRSTAQSTNVTTVAVTDLWPTSYQLVSNVYNRITGKYTVTWKMNMVNDGNGAATDVSAKMTGTSIPVGVVVSDDTVVFTTPDSTLSGGETQLSTDTFSYTYPRTAGGPDLTKITWDITYKDGSGGQHVIRSVKQ